MSSSANDDFDPAKVLPVTNVSSGSPQIEESPKTGENDSLSLRLAAESSQVLLAYRLNQQAILSEFGLEALQSRDLDAMLGKAAALCAGGMQVTLCKILQYVAASDDLLIRAGVGWKPGVVGVARLAADTASPAGYALKTGKPVISNHLENEERFRTPDIFAEYRIRRAVNVLIVTINGAWGVLEVDSSDEGRFETADIAFLQGFANLIGVAIERQEAEDGLKSAVEHQKLLVLETSHRVKNSLALVSSLLHLQARSAPSRETAAALEEAAGRIAAIAEAHNQLWRAADGAELDLAAFIPELCERLRVQAPRITLTTACDTIHIPDSIAVALGLVLTELVTNAMKHAYANGEGEVRVTAKREQGAIVLEVADDGDGLPGGFDFAEVARKSLGMRMVRSLAAQLHGQLSVHGPPGTRFRLVIKPEEHARV